jgi:DNA modification methylase
MAAATERDVIGQLRGSYTLEQLYAIVAATPAATRRNGQQVIHGVADTRWRRRVRGLLQTMRRQGNAQRVGDGVWVIEGSRAQPRAAILLSPSGAHMELRLSTAVDLLKDLDHPADLVFADPPWSLGQGQGEQHDVAARTSGAIAREEYVVPGYVDVPAGDYRDFTTAWVNAAAGAIRTGGYLCAVTGAQQAAWVQVMGELAGLTYVNSVAIGKVFPLRTTRRFAHAHWRATILCAGPLTSSRRTFTPPADLPKAKSGLDYPQDLWPTGSVGRVQHRAGTTRYRNQLPTPLVHRLIRALTRRPNEQHTDLVADPFLGGGTAAKVCRLLGLRYVGGDVNPHSLPYTMTRITGTPETPRTAPRANQMIMTMTMPR